MNWKAIDAGVDAIHKVDVHPGVNPEADPAPKALTGRPELVKQIRGHGAHCPYGRRQPACFLLRGKCKRRVGAGAST